VSGVAPLVLSDPPDEPLRGGSAQDLSSRAIRDPELLISFVRPTTGCAGSATRRLVAHQHHRSMMKTRSSSVYDMYPDTWGPANHQPENPHSHDALQASLDLRDNGGQRPDDN
jgi:hypothetical protein